MFRKVTKAGQPQEPFRFSIGAVCGTAVRSWPALECKSQSGNLYYSPDLRESVTYQSLEWQVVTDGYAYEAVLLEHVGPLSLESVQLTGDVPVIMAFKATTPPMPLVQSAALMCLHSLPIAWLKKLATHFFVDLQGEVTL